MEGRYTHGESPGPGLGGQTLKLRRAAAAAALLDVDTRGLQLDGGGVGIGKWHGHLLGVANDSFVLHQLLYLFPLFIVFPRA